MQELVAKLSGEHRWRQWFCFRTGRLGSSENVRFAGTKRESGVCSYSKMWYSSVVFFLDWSFWDVWRFLSGLHGWGPSMRDLT